jgi:capsular exopolysaccharide synthesis family protein
MTENSGYDGNHAGSPEFNEGPTPGLSHYLGILWRRKWAIVAVFVLVCAGGTFKVLRTEPLYSASTTVMVEQANRRDVISGDVPFRGWYPNAHLANHIQMLYSQYVRELVLQRIPESLVEYAQTLVEDDSTAVSASWVLGHASLSVTPIQDTDILRIAVTSSSARFAKSLANLYAEVYRDFELEQSRTDVESVRQFIEEQLNVVGRRLDIAEIGLEEFKKENRFINLSAETNALISQQSNLAVALAQTATELEGIQAQLTHVRQMIDEEGSGMSDKLESISSPLVASFKASLDELEVERANLTMQGYPESSATMQKLDRQITDIRNKLALESKKLLENQGFIEPVGRLRELWDSALSLETDLSAVLARKRVIEAAIIDHRAKLRVLPEVERTFAKLNRDVQADRRVYEMLSQRYEEARIQEAGRVSSVRIVDSAQGAVKIRPRVQRSLTLILLVALVLGLCVGIVFEFFDTSIRSPEQLERFGLSVLVNIPVLSTTKSRKARWGQAVQSHLITHADPASSGAEAFRVLRSNILFMASARSNSVIVVTSPGPSEGKSTAAVNLSASLANAGHKTLLIDADLRAPILHSVFSHSRKPGLSDLVVFDETLKRAIFPAGLDNLFCLSSGTIPPSPSDVLISPKMDELMSDLRGQFDFIVFDSPPALLAADTAILASKVDAVLLVIKAGSTSHRDVENTLTHLSHSGASIIGAVLNGLKTVGRYGADYYYYYSGHSYKYHKKRRRKDPSLAEEEKTA